MAARPASSDVPQALRAHAFKCALQCIKGPIVVEDGEGARNSMALPPVVRREAFDCFHFLSTPTTLPSCSSLDEGTQDALVQDLQRVCGVSPLDSSRCLEEVAGAGKGSIEVRSSGRKRDRGSARETAKASHRVSQRQLEILKQRLLVLRRDAHPFYSPGAYEVCGNATNDPNYEVGYKCNMR